MDENPLYKNLKMHSECKRTEAQEKVLKALEKQAKLDELYVKMMNIDIKER